MGSEPRFIDLPGYVEYPIDEMRRRARSFERAISRRRTVREFAERAVPRDVIESCLIAAGSAPSGANRQPWHFVVVSDPDTKRRIRAAAEEEERLFYEERAPADWLAALKALGTDAHKPFLERAPILIAIFGQSYVPSSEKRLKNYYVQESVGIATGLLIAALHEAGLASLTHTPSPMKFLNEVLGRPPSERPFLLLVVGYPAPDARVPDISRKRLEEFTTFM